MDGFAEVMLQNTIPTPRSPGRTRSDVTAPEKVLVRRLYQLYAAERLFSMDLLRLFRQSASIPVRLVLSDQRRDASRQILRLERSIQLTTGAVDPGVVANLMAVPRAPHDLNDREFVRGAQIQWAIAFPLLAVQGAVTAYRSAISFAKRVGEMAIVTLLAESLSEKRNTAIVLSRLAEAVE